MTNLFETISFSSFSDRKEKLSMHFSGQTIKKPVPKMNENISALTELWLNARQL